MFRIVWLRYLLLVVYTGFMFACVEDDENAHLKQALDNIISAVEAHSASKVNQYLSPDFKTTKHTGINDIQGLMLLHFRSNSVIRIFTSDLRVNIENGRGQISFNALVTGSSHWLPERGQRFLVKTRWNKVAGDWKLDRLDWEKAG